MKYKKWYLIVLITALSIVLNLLGRVFATKFNLPVWFDSFGTVLIAYIYGPICGIIVGLINNFIYGIFVETQWIYCVVGGFIGGATGVLSKRGAFKTSFNVMTLGATLAFLCTVFSFLINYWFFDGGVGNIWADQIILMCTNNSIPKIVASLIAQFYIEFLDKIIIVYLVFFTIKLSRIKFKFRKNGTIASVLIVSMLLSGICSLTAYAADGDNNFVGGYEDYDTYTHTVYSTDEGLLAGEANDIEQTKEGQLWIGTYAGLYSYDGITFNLYNDIDSIKNVNDLYVDEEGRLWVGTNDNGVTMMINGHVMNVIDVDDGLLSNSIRSIVCDSNGFYYIGSSSGISIVTLSGGVEVYKSFDEVKNTIRLAANSQGEVIAVTDKGELYTFINGELVDNTIVDIDGRAITSAYFSGDNKLYIGADDNKVLVYSDGTGAHKEREYTCFELERINSFYQMDNGDVFIISDNGVGYLDKDRIYKYVNTDRFTSSIDNMLVDYQGNLWFSSSRLGLMKLCKSPFTSMLSEISLEDHVVNAAISYNGMLYCGTDDGLIIIDESIKKSVSNELTDLLSGIRIRSFNVDSEDNLWISTTGSGLFRVKASGDSYVIDLFNDSNGMPGKRIRCSIQLSNGEIIAVGDDGIAFISSDSVVDTITSEDGLVDIKSLCVLEYKGKVYVGSDGGGITIIDGHSIVGRITRTEGLSSDVILRMVYDKNSDGLFVVTSNGLCYISADGDVTWLDKFPYSNNFDVIPAKGEDVWVLSSAGIFLASSSQLIENIERDYDLLNSRRGLRSDITPNSYSYVKDGSLYLCCDDDLVKVGMENSSFSARSYRMILNTVRIDGMDYEISRSKTLNISADAKDITFSPVILNYSLNDPYISYCLYGVDSDEKVVLLSELNDITYSNIKPGRYIFRISVLDGSRQNVIETGRYIIVKEVEMYQTWWFRAYFIMVALLIVIWITWFITKKSVQRTVREQQLELEYAKKQLEMGNATILSIARTVDAKDPNTSEHSYRVSQYSVAIAKRYGFDSDRCEIIRQMALLHDIGKIGIPDAILNKPAKLDEDEYAIMKSHVTRGGEILKDFTLIENVSIGALYHHERYDGKGYCAGLKGEEIPIEARIIGIADAFDAMTANRVYRKKLDIDVVISELKSCRGAQFDPELTDIMLALIEEKEINIEVLYKESKESK